MRRDRHTAGPCRSHPSAAAAPATRAAFVGIFVAGDGRTLPVPAHRLIKPVCIRKFLELIEGIG